MLPESIASMISSMVMILVTLAGARASWAFFSNSTVPVAASISRALFAFTSISAARVCQGSAMHNRTAILPICP